AGKAEHQQGLWMQASDQFRQLAIDPLIGDMEDVAGQLDRIERGAAQFGQPRDQRHGRIAGRPGKRTEAGDEDPQLFAHFSISAIWSAASAGAMRPSATSASTFFTRARTAASDRNRDMIRCSSIDHIHFTCCSRRRAANSLAALMALRWSRIFCQSSAMDASVKAE